MLFLHHLRTALNSFFLLRAQKQTISLVISLCLNIFFLVASLLRVLAVMQSLSSVSPPCIVQGLTSVSMCQKPKPPDYHAHQMFQSRVGPGNSTTSPLLVSGSFSCINWYYHMIFILHFINMTYHSNLSADVKQSLHP